MTKRLLEEAEVCGERLDPLSAEMVRDLCGALKQHEWQPIETAPRDGTRILTFGRGHGNRIMSHEANEPPFPMYAVAYWAWHDDERDVEVSPGLYKKEPCRVLEGWRTEWSYTPTHWQSLPEPPEAQK